MDKQQKDKFIRDYVEKQKAYISAYRDDGSRSQMATPRQEQREKFWFDTPVLQPRKPRPLHANSHIKEGKCPRRERVPAVQDPDKRLAPCRVAVSQDGHNKENKRPHARKSVSNRSKGKRTSPMDDEYVARLEERRERKRQRRAIVRPDIGSKDGKHGSNNMLKQKHGKMKKTRVSSSAAFALLHGFSAANVKRDRLTLKPGGSLGVFIKGKASTKTKVSSKKSKQRTTPVNLFSEFEFLNKAQRKDKGRTDQTTLPSSSTSCQSSSTTSREASTSCHPIPEKENTNQDSTLSLRAPATRPGSAVWDIELQDKCLSDVCDSSVLSDKPVSSVVLNLSKSHWFASANAATGVNGLCEESHSSPRGQRQLAVITPQSAPRECDDPPLLLHSDSSSLRPSHSASQAGHHMPIELSSKYFTQPVLNTLTSIVQDPRPSPATGGHNHQSQEVPIGTSLLHIDRALSDSVGASPDVFQPMSFRTPYDPTVLDISSGLSNDYVDECRADVALCSANHSNARMRCLPPASSVRHAQGCNNTNVWEPITHGVSDGHLVNQRNDEFSLFDPHGDDGFVGWYDPNSEQDITPVSNVGMHSDPGHFQPLKVDELDSRSVVFTEADDTVQEYRFGCHPSPVYEHDEDEGYRWDDMNMLVNEDDQDYDINLASFCGTEQTEEEHQAVMDFSEGRALLFGFSNSSRTQQRDVQSSRLMDAEVDVARRLHGHWRPQRH